MLLHAPDYARFPASSLVTPTPSSLVLNCPSYAQPSSTTWSSVLFPCISIAKEATYKGGILAINSFGEKEIGLAKFGGEGEKVEEFGHGLREKGRKESLEF